MNQLIVPFLGRVAYGSTPQQVIDALAAVSYVGVREVSWAAFPYRPSVCFRIAHTVDSIVLEFQVKEQHMNAVYRQVNDPVYKDSCVEFFLSFDGHHYYNLEFNCIGVGLIGYGGRNKNSRYNLAPTTVEQVRTHAVAMPAAVPGGDQEWRLLLNIPFTVFEQERIVSLSGMRCTGNFYKCGDDLPVPHFVSWTRIAAPEPDFHLPEFFGELLFESNKLGI